MLGISEKYLWPLEEDKFLNSLFLLPERQMGSDVEREKGFLGDRTMPTHLELNVVRLRGCQALGCVNITPKQGASPHPVLVEAQEFAFLTSSWDMLLLLMWKPHF